MQPVNKKVNKDGSNQTVAAEPETQDILKHILCSRTRRDVAIGGGGGINRS